MPGVQADGPQQPRDRIAKLGVVINDQDTGICVTHSWYPALEERILSNDAILRANGRDEQYLLPKRTAQSLSHRLAVTALRYWGMSLTLRHGMLCKVLPRQYGGSAWKPRC